MEGPIYLDRIKDYEAVFERFKLALMDSVALHYPNYEWPWILRVDASDHACGAALLQQRPSDGALLPINLSSHKFSGSAQRWPVIEKEGYACVFGIKPTIISCNKRNSFWKLITTIWFGLMQV